MQENQSVFFSNQIINSTIPVTLTTLNTYEDCSRINFFEYTIFREQLKNKNTFLFSIIHDLFVP